MLVCWPDADDGYLLIHLLTYLMKWVKEINEPQQQYSGNRIQFYL